MAEGARLTTEQLEDIMLRAQWWLYFSKTRQTYCWYGGGRTNPVRRGRPRFEHADRRIAVLAAICAEAFLREVL